MPSSYTHYVLDNKIDNAVDFLKLCTGYVISKGEDDKLIFTRQPAGLSIDYFEKNIASATAELDKLKAMTIEDAQKLVDEQYEKRQQECKDTIAKYAVKIARLHKIISELKLWKTSTDDQEHLKKWSIEHLEQCIERDCNYSYYTKALAEPKQSPEKYIEEGIRMYTEEVAYHTRKKSEAIERAKTHDETMEAFEKSLSAICVSNTNKEA